MYFIWIPSVYVQGCHSYRQSGSCQDKVHSPIFLRTDACYGRRSPSLRTWFVAKILYSVWILRRRVRQQSQKRWGPILLGPHGKGTRRASTICTARISRSHRRLPCHVISGHRSNYKWLVFRLSLQDLLRSYPVLISVITLAFFTQLLALNIGWKGISRTARMPKI